MDDSRGLGGTLVDIVTSRAAAQPDRRAITYLEDGELKEQRLTFGEIDARARRIAVRLLDRGPPGERGLILCEPGLDYVTAYIGCLYAGWWPVPTYPPDPARLQRTLPRVLAILREAEPRAIVTTSMVQPIAKGVLESKGVNAEFVSVDEASAAAGTESLWKRPDAIGPEAISLVQYTSGSISLPRGVLVTHRNLIHNLIQIARVGRFSEESVGSVWLPPYHDMGLIGGILGPLYSGFHVVLMSPLHFLMQPVRWLRAAHAYRGSILPGPNFAYSLCARRLTEADVEGLDLSCVETIFNGAEPIRRTAMQDFIDALAPCGLRPDVFVPCYGLAESTLIVTAADRHPPSPRYFDSAELTRGVARVVSEDHEGAALEHMSAGKPVDAEVLIVDPETRTPVSDRHVGEVWVRSQSVAQGYWRRPDETRAAFGAMTSDGRGPWLRSGDLGFMLDGELTLTSRLKDLIVLRGRNLSPPDIEATVESTHGAIRRGCAVAFSLDIEGEERLVVLCEVERRYRPDRRRFPSNRPLPRDRRERRADRRRVDPELGHDAPEPQALNPEDIISAIVDAVAREHDTTVTVVALVRPGSLYKTPSGKIQRNACREAFLTAGLDIIAERRTGVRARS